MAQPHHICPSPKTASKFASTASPSSPPIQIDHVVILLPSRAHLASPPKWITDNFTISPGGVYADGKTENRLILFRDGTYIELLAFVTESARNGHPWGHKRPGIIDFAFTTPPSSGPFDQAGLQGRITASQYAKALGINYPTAPIEGGMTRTDGQKVRWKVTIPNPPSARGASPSWCHDITPRSLRVPPSPPTHPSGTLGIAQLTVLVPEEPKHLEHCYTALYAAIANSQPLLAMGTTRIGLNVPNPNANLMRPWLFIETPEDGQKIKEVALVDVAFRTGTRERGGGVGTKEHSFKTTDAEGGFWVHFLK